MRTFIACPVERNELTDEILGDLKLVKGLSPVRTPELHITLHFFGDTSEVLAGKISSGLMNLKFPGFRIEMSGLGCFPSVKRPRVIYIGVKGFQRGLYDSVLKAAGIKAGDGEFVPHITVGRIRETVDVQNLIKKYEDAEFGSPEIKMVCYYRSDLKPTGPVYTEIVCAQLM